MVARENPVSTWYGAILFGSGEGSLLQTRATPIESFEAVFLSGIAPQHHRTNHGREALPLAMILLLCLETVEGTRKKRDTPSHYLPKGRRERKREKKKKRGGKKGRKSHVSLKWLYIQNK